MPPQWLCLKPPRYGRFSPDHRWPLLGDRRGYTSERKRTLPPLSTFFFILETGFREIFSLSTATRKTSDSDTCHRLNVAGDQSRSSARSTRNSNISCFVMLSACRSPNRCRKNWNLHSWL